METDRHFYFGFSVGSFFGVFLLGLPTLTLSHLNIFTILATSSGIGALIPDTLEPPYSRNHRKIFHSLRFLLALNGFLCFLLLTFSAWFPNPVGIFLLGLLTGYISHLVTDAFSPTGLPL